MTTKPPVVKGLDIGPESDPSWFMAQPSTPVEDIDPSQTDDPFLRELQIELRREAGLPDYPPAKDRRHRAAD